MLNEENEINLLSEEYSFSKFMSKFLDYNTSDTTKSHLDKCREDMISICLDSQPLAREINDKELENIRTRIPSQKREINLSVFKKEIISTEGRVFTTATFSQDEKGDYCYHLNFWQSQQLFCLEFNLKFSYSWRQLIKRCKEYNIIPILAYSSFGMVNNNFLMIFMNEFKVTDIRIQKVIQSALMMIFPEATRKCESPIQIYSGGKEILFEDVTARIRPDKLIKSMYRCMKVEDSHNYSRNIKNFCLKTGMILRNNVPAVDVRSFPLIFTEEVQFPNIFKENEAKPKFACERFLLAGTSRIPYERFLLMEYSRCASYQKEILRILRNEDYLLNNNGNEHLGEKLNGLGIPFNYFKYTTRQNGELQHVALYFATKGRSKGTEYKTHDFCQVKLKDPKPNKSITQDETISKCLLLQDFVNGKYVTKDEWFLIAALLTEIMGGKKWLKKWGSQSPQESLIKQWEYELDYWVRQQHKLTRCDDSCRYHQRCYGLGMMTLDSIFIPRGKVIVYDSLTPKPLQEAEEELQSMFAASLEEPNWNVHIIKASAGLGKTENYLGLEETTIAVPNHKLKKEVAHRMEAKGNPPLQSPELPKFGKLHDSIIQKLYRIGDYGGAHDYIEKVVAPTDSAARDYLKELRVLEVAQQTIITTHERLPFTRYRNPTIIIDEDILDTLYHQGSILVDDLMKLKGLMQSKNYTRNQWYKDAVDYVTFLLDQVVKADCKQVYNLPGSVSYVRWEAAKILSYSVNTIATY